MKHVHFSSLWLAGLLFLAAMAGPLPTRAQTLQQVISRENSAFSLLTMSWNVGLDGNVYFCDENAGMSSYLLRLTTTGSQKTGTLLATEAAGAVAANANGIIAVCHGHVTADVKLYDANFNLLGTASGFNGSQYNEPSDVEVGEQTGNFYALDSLNNRIIEISGQSGNYGEILAYYPYPTPPATSWAFRVSEKNNIVYLINSYVNGNPSATPIVAYTLFHLSATSTPLWSLSDGAPNNTGVSVYGGCLYGGVAVDSNGILYTQAIQQSVIQEWNSSGTNIGSVTLSGEPAYYQQMRVYNGQVFLRYWDPGTSNGSGVQTQLFQSFNLSTGALVNTIAPAEDVLTASYGVTIAGTVAISNGSTTVTGTGTSFTTALAAGNSILIDGQLNTIKSITSNTQLTVNTSYTVSAGGVPLVQVAQFDQATWTAGAVTPFTLGFTTTNPVAPAPNPTWHVWGRPYDTAVTVGSTGQPATTYQDFGYTTTNGGQITVPTGAAGLYQLKVTPEQAGWQRGTVSPYFLQDTVEIQAPGAVGTISVYTTSGVPLAGTVAISNGNATVTGAGTSFTTALYAGETVFIAGQFNTVSSITSNTQMTMSANYTQSASGALYYLCPSSTSNNRLHFNAGDTIPFTVSVRCPTANVPSSVTVDLTDMNDNVIATGTATMSSSQTIASLFIPSAMTAGLLPGSYTLNATTAGFTCVPQPLIIGPGLQKPPFRFTLFGDYGNNYVAGTLSQERDLVANQAVFLKKMGVTLAIDRLNTSGILGWGNQSEGDIPDGLGAIQTVQNHLNGEPNNTDPNKAAPECPIQQTVAAYSAGNTEQMSILLANDAGLPLGGGFDNRQVGNWYTPGTFEGDLTNMTNRLLPYSCFRGWVWAANWWNFFNATDETFTQTQIDTYNSDLATAQSSGVWNASGTGILDTMTQSRLDCPVDAWTTLASTPIIQANPQLVQSTAAPFRNDNSYPPYTFGGLNESDGQAQWEQYMLPWHTMWNIDYHKMPGEGARVHPEIWNDTGTGEQILQNTFMALLRQADGVGCSTNWGGQTPMSCYGSTEDTRGAWNGTTSVFRAMNAGVLQAYGPWLTTLTKNSPVALVISERQMKLDYLAGTTMCIHYGRLYEAYIALMHCHYPADLIFTTNMTSTSLNGYQAVFLVDQWVELDGNTDGTTGGLLQTALTNAHNAGAQIFYDGDCKDVDNVFSTFGATALGISFNQFEKLPGEAGSDSCFFDMLTDVRNDEPAITAALSGISAPSVTGVDEIFTAQSVQGCRATCSCWTTSPPPDSTRRTCGWSITIVPAVCPSRPPSPCPISPRRRSMTCLPKPRWAHRVAAT